MLHLSICKQAPVVDGVLFECLGFLLSYDQLEILLG